MMLRQLISTLLLLLSGCLWAQPPRIPIFSPEEMAWLENHPRLILSIDNTYPPNCYIDNKEQLVGINVDYMRLLERKLGIELVLKGSTWGTAFTAAMNHETDGVVNATALDERRQRLNFSLPFTNAPLALVVRSDFGPTKSLADMKGRKIAVKEKSAQLKMAAEVLGEDNCVEVATLFEAVELLSMNKVDGIFDDLLPLYYLISKYKLGHIRIAFLLENKELTSSRIALRNNDPMLVQVFDKAIASITEDEHKSITDRWLPPGIYADSSGFYAVIFLLAGLALFALVMAYTLRKMVLRRTRELQKELAMHRQTAQALRQSEHLLQQVLQASPVAIALTLPDGTTQRVNQQFVSLFGYSEKEIRSSDDWFRLAFPHLPTRLFYQRAWREAQAEYSQSNRPPRLEAQVHCKGGEIRDVEVRMVALPETRITTFVDLTEQKHYERELSKEKEFSEKSVNSMPGIFYLFVRGSEVYHLVRWNRNLETVTGFTDDEIFGRSPEDLMPGMLLTDTTMSGSQLLRSEGRLRCKANTHIPYYFSSSWFEDQGMRYIVGVGLDITERLKLEEELEAHKTRLEFLVEKRTAELANANNDLKRANQDLADINRLLLDQKQELETTLEKLKTAQSQLVQSEKLASLGILTAGIAHEINNPVNFILASIYGLQNFVDAFVRIYGQYKLLNSHNAAELLPSIAALREEFDFDFLEENLESSIKIIGNGADRIAGIIKGLHSFARDGEEPKLNVNLRETLESTISLLRHEMRDRIALHWQWAPNVPAVSCYPGKLNQVFMNLLINAMQAIPAQGDIRISAQYEARTQLIDLRITDSGTGIAPELSKKIFEPFFTTKGLGKGTGLGLFISYNILQEHKGSLNLLNTSSSGTCFQILLPSNPFGAIQAADNVVI